MVAHSLNCCLKSGVHYNLLLLLPEMVKPVIEQRATGFEVVLANILSTMIYDAQILVELVLTPPTHGLQINQTSSRLTLDIIRYRIP